MHNRKISDTPVEATCPLCGSRAERLPTNGDWSQYNCPQDMMFDITDTAEAEAKLNEQKRKSHRQRIKRERQRGIDIPKIGDFPAE